MGNRDDSNSCSWPRLGRHRVLLFGPTRRRCGAGRPRRDHHAQRFHHAQARRRSAGNSEHRVEVIWGEWVEGSARELLAGAELEPTQPRSARADAEDWLRDQLAMGPRATNAIRSAATLAGFAWRTIERAKLQLQVRASKSGVEGGWQWSLADPDEDRQGRQAPTNESSGGVGGLAESAPISSRRSRSQAHRSIDDRQSDQYLFDARSSTE